ncbi:MAG TPA: MarR family winged helix-turn-helix transcriptional regulator [Novosphingobium sp.]|nr:MarR family winged helix-turn-helix transcriptional regulator [Novosphingobium sp.]
MKSIHAEVVVGGQVQPSAILGYTYTRVETTMLHNKRWTSAAPKSVHRLSELTSELARMADELGEIAEQRDGEPCEQANCDPVDMAMSIYRNRRRRGQIFGDDDLFGEPAWDMLLDLYVAEKNQKRIAVTSACIGAAVPPTTALRWIRILEDKQLILREVDKDDARRTFVRLSPLGCERMEAYFAAHRTTPGG